MLSKFKENEYCICVHCNTRIPHERGIPCRQNKCPNCGKIMFKEGSYHHLLYLKKLKDEKKQDPHS
jgi:predicted RNA-binding Zn-ribbon protein involved in translation (DUF1610 family)